MRKSDKNVLLVQSTDSILLNSLADLEISFSRATQEATNEKFDLVVDIDNFGTFGAAELIRNNAGYENLLVVAGSELSIDDRVILASVGVDKISHKENLLLEISNFLKSSDSSSKRKILLIDDSETDLYVISSLMVNSGFEVEEFTDAHYALSKIDTIQPDAVLVDIHMPPPLDGPTFVRTLRQMAKYASLPIIFVSSENKDEIKIQALESGADEILTKPINSELSKRIINKHIKRSLQQSDQINRDPLTKAFNRNYLNTVKEKLVNENNNFIVAILDIDHFKNLNDEFGHDFGDYALRHMSGLLQRKVRSKDYVFRFGGEEFVLLIDSNDINIGFDIVERLRKSLERSKIVNNNQVVQMTFSAGVSMCIGNNYEQALKLADELLYEAKRSGRNQTMIKQQ